MNLLITLAVTALVGGSALFVSTVAPESVKTENDTQAHVSTDVSTSAQTDETSTSTEEAGANTFSSKVKNFLHLDISDEDEKSTKINTQADVDASVEADTDMKNKTEGSGLIEVTL